MCERARARVQKVQVFEMEPEEDDTHMHFAISSQNQV